MKKMNLRWIACTGLLMICVMSPSIKAYAANTPLDSISLSPDVTAPIKLPRLWNPERTCSPSTTLN